MGGVPIMIKRFLVVLAVLVCILSPFALNAEPRPGVWDTANGDFSAGVWYEALLGGTEGTPGNMIGIEEVENDDYVMTGATLMTVDEKSPHLYETRYEGGQLLLTNKEPWGYPGDPENRYAISVTEVIVTKEKFYDDNNLFAGTAFSLTGHGVFDDYPGYTTEFTGHFTGIPFFKDGVIWGQLDGASLAITGPAQSELLMDIKPDSAENPVNVRSRGVLPVAILGSASLSVEEIDAASVALAGVSALRSSIEDVSSPQSAAERGVKALGDAGPGPDGYEDLVLKFSTHAVIASIDSIDIADGDRVVLTISGLFKDGTAFAGRDSILVIKKTSKGKTADSQQTSVENKDNGAHKNSEPKTNNGKGKS